jgi:hypothetical protein
MSHKRKVVLRVVIGLLGLCATSLLVTYLVLRPARAIGPGQQHNTEPESESNVPLPDPATVYINGTLYRCVCDPEGAYIEISVVDESEPQSDATPPNAAWVDCDGTFYRCVCDSGGVSMEVVVPTLTLSPDTGALGQTIRVIGASFARETSVALRLGVPNAGLSKENLATAVADVRSAFEVELTLPTEWPGAQTPIVERELVIAAVDEVRGQTLAFAQFTNEEGQPTLALNPGIGTPGQTIQVTGGTFVPGTRVALRLGVPNAGLSKENLATAVADADGAFGTELMLPTEWTGTQTPIVERELVIAAVDEVRGQTLAVAQVTNAAAVRAEAVPTVHNVHSVQIADTGLVIEVPDGWFRLEQEWAWTPQEGSDVRLGVNWMDLQPPMEPEAVMLPAPSQTLHSEEVMLNWGQGRRFLLEVYAPATHGSDGKATVESVETHVLAVVSRGGTRRAFDLYVRSSKLVDMEQLDPLLQRVLDTSILAGAG